MVLAGDVWFMARGGFRSSESFPGVWWPVVSGRGSLFFSGSVDAFSWKRRLPQSLRRHSSPHQKGWLVRELSTRIAASANWEAIGHKVGEGQYASST